VRSLNFKRGKKRKMGEKMTKAELKRMLAELELEEAEEKRQQLEELKEKEAAAELRTFQSDFEREELIGLEPGRFGILNCEVEYDAVSDWDPLIGIEVLGEEEKEKQPTGYGDNSLDVDDDVQEARSVQVQSDILSDEFGQ